MLIHSPKELALFVINQRKILKLSQAEIGKRVGLKQKTISAFENKPEGSKLETLFLIISAVNSSMSLSNKDASNANKTQWKQEW